MTPSLPAGCEARRSCFVWPSWLAPLISSDRNCWWSAWFKSHFKFQKVPHTDNMLALWKAEHAVFVQQRAVQLQAEGWTVYLEDQNVVNVRGDAATVGGKADIVAFRDACTLFDDDGLRGIAIAAGQPPELQVHGSQARVEDCKTGKPKEADYWQVITYMVLLPITDQRFKDRELTGAVVYKDHVRTVSAYDAEVGKPQVVNAIKKVAQHVPLRRVPSAAECARCDILGCDDRMSEADEPAQTDMF